MAGFQKHPPRLIFAILGASIVTILLVCINGHKKTTNPNFLYTNLITFGPPFRAAAGGYDALLAILFQPDRRIRPAVDPPARRMRAVHRHLVYEIRGIVY